MNGIILRVFALGLMVTLGHALQCYKCDIGILGICATSKETCKAGELCFSGVGKAASVMDIKMKGCLLVAQCNKTTQTTGLGNTTIYSMTKTCCATDLCNAAPGHHALSTLPLVLATLTSMLMATSLV